MTFREAAQRSVNSIFARLGEDAAYTASGGEPVSVRVVRRQPDEIVDIGSSRIQTETAVFLLRIAELALPRAGDVLQIDSESFVIQGEPQREQHGLVWKIDGLANS